jgi:hypothetical protein
VEKEKATVAMQWHDKLVSVATISDATIDDAVFSVRSLSRLYSENQQQQSSQKYKRLKRGGGQAYDRSSD